MSRAMDMQTGYCTYNLLATSIFNIVEGHGNVLAPEKIRKRRRQALRQDIATEN